MICDNMMPVRPLLVQQYILSWIRVQNSMTRIIGVYLQPGALWGLRNAIILYDAAAEPQVIYTTR